MIYTIIYTSACMYYVLYFLYVTLHLFLSILVYYTLLLFLLVVVMFVYVLYVILPK